MRLLPYNSTPQEIALEDTIANKITDIPLPIKSLWDSANCPPTHLPWLAWALSVDIWQQNWTDAQKREAIKQAAFIHRHKGTIGSLKRALKVAGFKATVLERPDNVPYRFNVTLDVTGVGLTQKTFDDCVKMIDETKNARSHLGKLTIKANVRGTVWVAPYLMTATRTRINPYTARVLTSLAKISGGGCVLMAIRNLIPVGDTHE